MTGVRRFAPDDAAACCAVINAAAPTMDGLNAAARRFILEKNTPDRLGQELDRLYTVVYVQAGTIVGLGALDEAEIKRVYVLTAARWGQENSAANQPAAYRLRMRGRQKCCGAARV